MAVRIVLIRFDRMDRAALYCAIRRTRLRRGVFALTLFCGTASLPTAARAQLILQNFPVNIPGYAPNLEASVVTHMMQEQQANGVEIGDFIIRPQVTETGGYDSAPIDAPDSGSPVINSQASVRINSDWGRNALGATFSVDDHRYLDLPVANYTNWNVGLGGALELGNDTVTLAYSHLGEHLGPQELGVIGVATPVPYGVDDVRLSYEKLFSRISLTPSFEFQSYKFGSSSGAASTNFDSLNHHVETGALTGNYAFSPGDDAVAIIRVSSAQFQTAPTDDYFDAGGYVGLDFRGDSIIQYRALIGYERRHFEHASNSTIGSPVFELDAVWMPTQLDTVTLSGFREFSDPTSAFARNQIITYGSLQLDHELHENIFLRATAHIGKSNPESDIVALGGENQTQYGFGLAMFWGLNRNIIARLSYSFLDNQYGQNSAAASTAGSSHRNFVSNTIMLGFTFYE